MATKIVNTLILILALNIKIVRAAYVYECADCHKTSEETCEIDDDAGFSCGDFKVRKVPRDEWNSWEADAKEADAEVPKVTDKLDVCIPPGLNVTGDHDGKNAFPICCVWSRELGCQLLAREDNDLWDCGVCRKHMHISYDSLKPCPCVPSIGSRKVFCGLWHVVIAIYCIFALFKL